MKLLQIAFILTLGLCPTMLIGQDISSHMFTDQYWGHLDSPYGDSVNYFPYESKKRIIKEARGGMIFHSDGKFEEVIRRTCNYDRNPFTGTWEITGNLIKVEIYDWLTWYYQIIEASDSKLVLKYWSEKHEE